MTKQEQQDEIERTCHLNGKRPNQRDIWRAFYRLWRIARHAGGYRFFEAETCLRVLGFWDFGILVDEVDPLKGGDMPLFLRRRFVEMARRKRLANEAENDQAARLLRAIYASDEPETDNG